MHDTREINLYVPCAGVFYKLVASIRDRPCTRAEVLFEHVGLNRRPRK